MKYFDRIPLIRAPRTVRRFKRRSPERIDKIIVLLKVHEYMIKKNRRYIIFYHQQTYRLECVARVSEKWNVICVHYTVEKNKKNKKKTIHVTHTYIIFSCGHRSRPPAAKRFDTSGASTVSVRLEQKKKNCDHFTYYVVLSRA